MQYRAGELQVVVYSMEGMSSRSRKTRSACAVVALLALPAARRRRSFFHSMASIRFCGEW